MDIFVIKICKFFQHILEIFSNKYIKIYYCMEGSGATDGKEITPSPHIDGSTVDPSYLTRRLFFLVNFW